jgi:hypothetical protein
MRILALSDIHGAYELAKRILRAERGIDLVIMAGDLTTFGTREEALDAVAGFRAITEPVLAVAGNMDTREIDEAFAGEKISINGKGVRIGNTGFFGVSGGPHSFLHTPFELAEEEILTLAEKGFAEVADAPTKVFVPHAPPHETKLDKVRSGKHVGSTAVRDFIQSRQPDLVICGHIHESAGEDTLGLSKMVNCGSVKEGRYAVIELEKDITLSLKTLA